MNSVKLTSMQEKSGMCAGFEPATYQLEVGGSFSVLVADWWRLAAIDNYGHTWTTIDKLIT